MISSFLHSSTSCRICITPTTPFGQPRITSLQINYRKFVRWRLDCILDTKHVTALSLVSFFFEPCLEWDIVRSDTAVISACCLYIAIVYLPCLERDTKRNPCCLLFGDRVVGWPLLPYIFLLSPRRVMTTCFAEVQLLSRFSLQRRTNLCVCKSQFLCWLWYKFMELCSTRMCRPLFF